MRHGRVLISYIVLALLLMAGTAAFALEDISEHRNCAHCGMDRKAYGYSRMLIAYDEGPKVGVCSLHCAVLDLEAKRGRGVKSLLVADRDTRSLIEAEKAVWGKMRVFPSAGPLPENKARRSRK